MLNPRQTLLIKLSWSHLSNRLEDFGETFYKILFELEPTLRRLFKNDMERQKVKFAAMMNYIVSHLQFTERLDGELQALGDRHLAYGVTSEQYDKVMIAFLLAMEKRLKGKWDNETREAWTMAFVYIGSQMKRG